MNTSQELLYDPACDRGACGLGFLARVDGRSSHELVEQGLQVLANLAHRGAVGADPETGDGAGILLQIPHAFFTHRCPDLDLPASRGYAVGTLFLSQDEGTRRECEKALERIAGEEGQPVIGWRDVPVNPDKIGRLARDSAPIIRQVFLQRTVRSELAFDRLLYLIRRRLHWFVQERFTDHDACYVVGLSARTIVYKGLLRGTQLAAFYPDLVDRRVSSSLVLVHSRFGTNTLGSWPLAHPYRYIAHNGEINALRGNINWMRAREHELQATIFPHVEEHLGPIVQPGGNDTSAFDNSLEFLLLAGRSLPHAVMTMVPEAWENDEQMDPNRRAFYRYTSSLMAPWDGPAAIVFSDGRMVGAALDRNGLRPARYSVTRDGLVYLASEEGVLPVRPEDVVSRSRLGPGEMIAVDTEKGRLLNDADLKRDVVGKKPYRRWVRSEMEHVAELPVDDEASPEERESLLRRQRVFGYTTEELRLILAPMAETGKEPDGSMGTDTPLAVLSERPQLLFAYFKQLFAQVSNPPIDSLRESSMMSLRMALGPQLNLVEEHPEHCEQIVLDDPLLTNQQLAKLRHLQLPPFHSSTLSVLFETSRGASDLSAALERLCREAEDEIHHGATILILSDRGIDAEHAAIPMLLATGAVHHHLVREGLRTRAGIVAETAEARDVHQIALLLGYGAAAINPYLAIETIEDLANSAVFTNVEPEQAVENYLRALRKGLLKIISKMGISTIVSYCGAQIFEAVGLSHDVIARYFSGTPSRLGGIGLEEIAEETLLRHADAFRADRRELDLGGELQYRVQGERHQWNPATIAALQRGARLPDKEAAFRSFAEFSRQADAQNNAATLRGLLEPRSNPIPLSEVEPAEEIVKRFSTGAMSFGSLSKEAHETLAVAMNRIGGKSNTGEGGEEPSRAVPDANGDSRRSAIKQVASGRFGVTTEYLVNADMLQIKMAQGSKPGEGGQLPGHKVSGEIASVRNSTPGVTLISPPPHHDIYSIEDLAQLIYDLKKVNPAADVSVKLVAEVGVGTIAAGVAKAGADHITISGHDGGTGASPVSSIKNAGLPWELGLAETQQVLVGNGLRGRVRLQVDGHLKTGRDVVMAALLGADEFGFSTAPLVALGCIMMRACHLNTCPVGIATQNPVLRQKFAGQPEHVINYFFFVAEQVRELMAQLGFERFDDMIGRVDRLRVSSQPLHAKACCLDLAPLLGSPVGVDQCVDPAPPRVVVGVDQGVDPPGAGLDAEISRLAAPAVQSRESVHLDLSIRNTDRSVGAALAGDIARRYGSAGLPDGTIHLQFTGTAGQSFGAWATRGMTLQLSGEANDYVGKGLSGATIAVAPPDTAGYEPERTAVIGNVALYGATSGEAYVRGLAGERFSVRNSGAMAVVEGVGDHGCEYMTGGIVVVLGPTGRNFAAGMSGGNAFVLDMWSRFADSCNQEMAGLEEVSSPEDVATLRHLLERHLEMTGSTVAQRVLSNWKTYLRRFVKVMPHDLSRALAESEAATDVMAEEQAV